MKLFVTGFAALFLATALVGCGGAPEKKPEAPKTPAPAVTETKEEMPAEPAAATEPAAAEGEKPAAAEGEKPAAAEGDKPAAPAAATEEKKPEEKKE